MAEPGEYVRSLRQQHLNEALTDDPFAALPRAYALTCPTCGWQDQRERFASADHASFVLTARIMEQREPAPPWQCQHCGWHPPAADTPGLILTEADAGTGSPQ